MTYKDIPQCPTNVFVLYSNATGIQNAELSDGIDVRNVIHQPVITSQTKMTIISGSSGFDKDGLHIKPKLSANGKQISFELKMTACNMTISDHFTLTITTAGDEETELQGVTETIKLKVICYGFDRPFLGKNFVEYDTHDGKLYRESVMPYSVNALASVGFGDSVLDDSGFTLFDRDDVENTNTVYYSGTPSAPGLYGLVVAAETYEGGANTPGLVPNAFPAGKGADALIISIYDGYFKKNDTAFAVSGKVDLEIENAPVNAPAGFNHIFTLYGGNMISGGSAASTGGAFTPVFSGDKWLYYKHKQVNQVANNTTETHEYRLLCNANPEQPSGELSDTWYLYYRYYLDDNKSNWSLLETAAGVEIDIPVKEDDNVTTYKAFVSVPPYSGWNNADASGDAAYFVKGYDFFNTVSLVSADNAFEPVIVYAGNNNRLLVKSSEQNGKVFFPDLAGWGIIEDGNVSSLDTAPQTIQYTVMPYAPAKEGDAAIGIEVDSALISQALNYANTDICIYSNGTAGGIWKRYPLQRLIQPEFADKLYAIVSGKDEASHRVRYEHISDSTCSGGTSFDSYGSITVSQPYGQVITQSGNQSAGVITASFKSEIPMDGIVYDSKGIVSFYGFSDKDNMEFSIEPSDWISRDVNVSEGYQHTVKRWYEDDVYETVTKPGYGSHEVPRTQGRQVHVIEDEYGQDSSTHEYLETHTHEEVSGTGEDGYADCLLRIGQADTADGRVLTFAPSIIGSMRGNKRYNYITETQEIVDGEVTSSDRSEKEITTGTNISGYSAEAYAREALPNSNIGKSRAQRYAEKVQDGDFRKWFSIRKVTAFTCKKYKYEVENKLVGQGEYEVHWYPPGSNSPGDRVIETFTTDCYANEGEFAETEYMYCVEEGVYCALICNDSAQGRPTYSLEMRKDDVITSSYTRINKETWLYRERAENAAYPFREYSEKSSSYEWSQDVEGGYRVMVIQDSAGNFTQERTVYPSMSADNNNPPPEVYPEAETTTTKHSWSPDDLLRMFNDFYAEFSSINSTFEPPDGEWDIITKQAQYAEFPFFSGDGTCEYTYDYGDTSNPPLVLTVDFKTK